MKTIAFCLLAFTVLAPAGADILCPPEWDPSVIYYQTFDGEKGAPEVNTAGLEVQTSPVPGPGGFRGRCGVPGPGAGEKELYLGSKGDALSPHRPLTIMFWWAPAHVIDKNNGYGLIQLSAGRGFIAAFAKGGPWCGLQDTAGVLQVWDLPGITNVNAIYNTALRQTLDLNKGAWHHTAMVISGASLVTLYTDGVKVYETRAQGRTFSAADGFNLLKIGPELMLDEVMILNRPLDADAIADYVSSTRQMRAAYGW